MKNLENLLKSLESVVDGSVDWRVKANTASIYNQFELAFPGVQRQCEIYRVENYTKASKIRTIKAIFPKIEVIACSLHQLMLELERPECVFGQSDFSNIPGSIDKLYKLISSEDFAKNDYFFVVPTGEVHGGRNVFVPAERENLKAAMDLYNYKFLSVEDRIKLRRASRSKK